MLALVAGQDVELVDPDDPGDPPRWRIARRVAPDRVISVVDPDARHAHKTVSPRQDGFKAHLAVEPETGLVTDCQLTKAAGADSHDAVVGMDLLTGETGPVEVLADSAYGTGEALATLDQAGHRPLVKPWPVTPADSRRVQHRRLHRRRGRRHRHLPGRGDPAADAGPGVIFGAACRGCPLRARCTTAKDGRTLHVHDHDALQRAHRRRAKTPPGRPTTASTGRWSNAPSPGSPPAATATPLPRHRQEQRLAAPPHRRPQPAPAAQPRPGPPRRSLGNRLTGVRLTRTPSRPPQDPR